MDQGDFMKFTPVAACLAALLFLPGCARMQVSYEIDSSYDFGRIQTYQWIEPPRDILDRDDTFLITDLQRALNNQLAARGWKQVLQTADATVQIAYYINIEEHEEYVESVSRSENEFAGGLVYNEGKWNYTELEPDQQVYTVETGDVHVTVTDTASGRPVWRGLLQTKLDRSATPEKQYELYQLAARRMLEPLPTGSK
jgi:hypothetical protein